MLNSYFGSSVGVVEGSSRNAQTCDPVVLWSFRPPKPTNFGAQGLNARLLREGGDRSGDPVAKMHSCGVFT